MKNAKSDVQLTIYPDVLWHSPQLSIHLCVSSQQVALPDYFSLILLQIILKSIFFYVVALLKHAYSNI